MTLYVKRFIEGRPSFRGIGGLYSTNDLGQYRIPELEEGIYYLLAAKRSDAGQHRVGADEGGEQVSLVGTFYPNSLSIDGAAPIQVRAGQQVDGLDIVMGTMPTHCVAATMDSDRPEDVAIIFQLYRVDSSFLSMTARGKIQPGREIEICGQREGSYRLLLTSLPDQTPGLQKQTGFLRTNFVITNSDIDLGRLTPLAGQPISGKVIVEGQGPNSAIPPGIIVRLAVQDRPAYYADVVGLSGPVKTTGEFRLESVFPDEYSLPGIIGLPPRYYLKEARQQNRDVMRERIRPGTDLVITLGSDGATIGGIVVDRDNLPVHDATVIVVAKVPQSVGRMMLQQSDQDGRFLFGSGIAPGEYALLASTDLVDGQVHDPDFLRRHLPHAASFTLKPNGQEHVVLTVRTAEP